MGLQSSVPCWVVGRMTDKLPFGGEVVRLGDVCEVVGGATPKTGNTNYWNGSIRWITPAELNNESHVVTDTAKHLTMDGFHSASLRMMPAGTVLLTTRAPIGKVAIAGAEMCCNQGFKNLICSNKVYNEYLYRYLKFHAAELQSLGSGATFKELSKRTVSNLQIYLPALDFQHEAIQKLSEVDRAIGYTNDLTSTLYDLVKFRFVEMFGDLERNDSCWPVLSFDDFAIIDTHMTNDFPAIADLPHIGIDSIESNTGRLSGYRTVAEDDVKSGKYPFTSKHIIYSKIRPALNKVALPTFSGVCSADAYPILPREAVCDRVFLAYVMRSPFFLKYILPLSGRAQMPKVNKNDLRGFSSPIPPLSLQHEFADFAARVDKLRFEQLLALKKRGSQYLIAP